MPDDRPESPLRWTIKNVDDGPYVVIGPMIPLGGHVEVAALSTPAGPCRTCNGTRTIHELHYPEPDRDVPCPDCSTPAGPSWITFSDEPATNSRRYRCPCGAGWMVPLDDCPSPVGQERECPDCAVCRPVAAPSPREEAVEAVVDWLRGDQAERVRADAIRDDVPPEDALAQVIERRFLSADRSSSPEA